MKMGPWIVSLLSILFMVQSSVGIAQSGSILLSIENPDFRKVLVAAPNFFVDQSVKDQQAADFGQAGSRELRRLLEFSGLFNIMADDAYATFLNGVQKRYKTDKDADWLVNMKGLNEEDWKQWKSLGVESLTLASLKQTTTDGLVLSIKTYDVNRRQELIAKQFQKISDYQAVIRKYADFILEVYTGKPGIFQSKLVFIGKKSPKSSKQVYISDFDGSNLIQISQGDQPHLSPSWSPDGRFITYTSYKNRSPNIFVYDTQTRKTRQLTDGQELNSGANWAPSGKLIAFSGSKEGDTDIYTITPAGAGRKRLIQGSGLDVDPKFSPDGNWLAFVSGRFGNPHIFVASIKWDNETTVRVTGDKRLTYAGWYNSTPDWSQDSDKIVFAGYDKDIDRYDLFLMNPDGSKLERLTLKTGDNESPSWSPNSQLIVFQSNRVGEANVKGPASLYIMNRDGSSQRKLETGLHEAFTPDWSSQSKSE